MFKVSANRCFSGFEIDGEKISIRLIPCGLGKINVRVIAHAAATGFDGSCTMGSEGLLSEYGPGEIQIRGGILECFAADRTTSLYAEGIRVVLEPGMADLIEQKLPALFHCAAGAELVQARFSELIGSTPWLHMADFMQELLAAIVLDGLAPGAALESVKIYHWAGKDEALMAPFVDSTIQSILSSAFSHDTSHA